MLISIGIDVGAKNGAIAIIDEDFNVLHLSKAPYKDVDMAHTAKNRVKPKLNKETGKYEVTYKKRSWTDYTKFRELFEPYIKGNQIVYTVERVSVRPDEGEISSFIFGNSLGCFEGLSAYLNPIFMTEPTPNVWKAEMGLSSDKDESIKLASTLFEDVNLRYYVPKGKLDDVSEALLLAVYGFKKYDDSIQEEIN